MARSALRKVSAKGRAKNLIYRERRKEFLSRPENQVCPVMLAIFGEKHQTTDVHHLRGRIGNLLLAEEHWLAVSRQGHDWIHAHPATAYLNGWLEKH